MRAQGDTRRARRYLVALAGGLGAVWLAAGAYMLLTRPSWTATFTLVIPGPGTATSLNLENVGSATSTNASVFSSPEISPTENYRRIILSNRMIAEASAASGVDPARFPKPKVELVEQTKLLRVSMTGKSRREASSRAWFLESSFLALLDRLREDEIHQRETRTAQTLLDYRNRLANAKEKLLEFQSRTGLSSADQYRSVVAGIEKSRDTRQEVAARLAKGRGEEQALRQLLAADPEAASRSLMLRSDPEVQALLDAAAKSGSEIAVLHGTRGPTNPRLDDARGEHASVLARLRGRVAEVLDTKNVDPARLKDAGPREERAQLLGRVVALSAENSALGELEAELVRQENQARERVATLRPEASTLDRLSRDVQLNEAVFTSALGRADSGRSDFFASYPMVQVLEEPYSTAAPTSPSLLLACVGAAAASVLVFIAVGIAWLRAELFRRMLKSA